MQLKIEKYGNGGYKTWLLDDGWKSVACENMFFNKMIQAFKATAYITKECNITKVRNVIHGIDESELFYFG